MRILLILAVAVVCAAAQEPRLTRHDAIELFNGRNLDGFVTRGGRYDGRAVWQVENGTIVGRQGPGRAGGLLYTRNTYRDFVFSVETYVEYPFDSGIFVRMAPKGKGAQVTLDYRPGGEVGAIYSDGFLHHNKEARSRWRKNAWNRFTVRCVGEPMRLTVWMNGSLITDFQVRKESGPFAPTGLIGVQVHGGGSQDESLAARFRNLYVREIPRVDPETFTADGHGLLTLTEKGREQGWRPLFNGRDLSGWEARPATAAWAVHNGVLSFPTRGGDGHLRTKKDFRDFQLRLDFRIAPMANSGLFLRADRTGGSPAFSGCEIQILDDFNWERVTRSRLKPYQFTGSLYGSVPAGEHGALRPLMHWNTLEVTYHGRRMRTVLNGRELYDVDTHRVPALVKGTRPFKDRAARGFIGLQRHAPSQVDADTYAWFRNIFIREIK